MTRIAAILLTLACAVWMPAAAAGSMRCEGRIIQEGALAAEVLGACGEPVYRDPWTLQSPHTHLLVVDTEEWYYNFGSSQLLRLVKIRNGKVVDIDSDGYGYNDPPRPPCDPLDIVPGLSKFRLILRCGDPVTRKSQSVLAPLNPRGGTDPFYGSVDPGADRYPYNGYLVPVFREEWVYNFGSRYLMRIVTLEDGRVSDVQNGNRGFD